MNIVLDTLASARSARWLGHSAGLLAYLGLTWLIPGGDLAWFAALLMAAALLVVEVGFSLLDFKARRLKALAPNAFPFKQMEAGDRAFLQQALATLPLRSLQRSLAAWVLATALLSAWHVSYIGMALLLASGAPLAALCQSWMGSSMLKRVLPFFYLGESGSYAQGLSAWLPGLPRRFSGALQGPLWVALLPLLLLSALGQSLTPGLLLYQGLLGWLCALGGRGLLLNQVDAPLKDLSLALKRFGGGDLDALLDITNGGSVGEVTESFNQALRAVDRRLFMLEKFGHSVPPGRSEGVLDELRLDGEHRHVAVLSAQWLGADAALRAMEPKARLNALGRFYEAVQDAVDRHQGCTFQLDDGAVLAVWGAPFNLEKPVEGALGAAWDLQTLLPVIARQQGQRDQVTLNWGLGLALGQASTGLAGPRDRERYSLHGGPLPEAKALAQRGGGVWLDERSAAAAQAPFGVSIGQDGARLIQGPQAQTPSPELLGFKPGELL